MYEIYVVYFSPLVRISLPHHLQKNFGRLQALVMPLIDWRFVCDMLDERQNWGKLIRRKLYCSNLSYKDRAYIAAFGFSNGIAPGVLTDAIAFVNRAATPQKLRKIEDLYVYWEGEGELYRERRRRYFAYNIIVGRVLDLNLEPREVRPWERALIVPHNRNRRDNDSDVIPSGYHC